MLLAKQRAAIACLAVLTCGQSSLPPAVRHVAPSRDDAFLACASRLLGKPTLRHISASRVSIDIACGESRSQFEAALSSAGLVVSDAGDWLVIHPTTHIISAKLQSAYAWKHLRIVPVIEARPSRHGLPLAAADLQAIGRRALAVSRLTPPDFPPGDGEQYDAELFVAVDAVQLRPGVESIVVVQGFPPTTARLVYGERRGGTYVPLWDSPILSTRGGYLGWEYVDVDHDGRSEIVFRGSEHPSYRTLVMFDLDGNELTRNGDCEVIRGALQSTNPTCPMVGESVEIEDAKDGDTRPRDIFVYQEDARDNKRYRLKHGVYVPAGRPPAP